MTDTDVVNNAEAENNNNTETSEKNDLVKNVVKEVMQNIDAKGDVQKAQYKKMAETISEKTLNVMESKLSALEIEQKKNIEEKIRTEMLQDVSDDDIPEALREALKDNGLGLNEYQLKKIRSTVAVEKQKKFAAISNSINNQANTQQTQQPTSLYSDANGNMSPGNLERNISNIINRKYDK